MIEKKNLLTNDWKSVEKYLKKDSDESIKLAIIEAEKVFLKVVNTKGYKDKKQEDKVQKAIAEVKMPETFVKSRETAAKLVNNIGFDFGDPYSAKEVVNSYKEAIEDLLFGTIDESKMASLKYRFWPTYLFFYERRKGIKRFLIWFSAVILLMLFIADTDLGRNLFDLFIDKIHFIIRMILAVLLIVFAIAFFITFSIILFESRARKKAAKRG